MPNVDPLDDFEKAIIKNAKPGTRKYDYRQLPNDVGGLVKAVAKSAFDYLTGNIDRDKLKKMVDENKKKQDDIVRKNDPRLRP